MAVALGFIAPEFLGSLFAGGADIAAADLGAAAAADIGATAGADIGAGIIGGDIAGTTAAEAAATGAAGELAAGGAGGLGELAAGAGALGAAGAGADIAAGAAGAAGDVGGGVAGDLAAAGGGLGEGVDSALALADTAAPQAGGIDTSLTGFLSDPGAATVGIPTPAATPATSAVPGAIESNLGVGGTVPASTELAGENPNLLAALGQAPPTPPTDPSLMSYAASANPAPTAEGIATPAATTPSEITTNADIVGQLGAEGGISPTANATSANALEALNNAPAAAGGGGITSQLGNVLNSPWTKAAELGIPLGMLGYNLAKGPAPIAPQANLAVQNAENQFAPLQGKAAANVDLYNQTAAADLNLANNFQISPAQAAAIKTDSDNAKNQLYQQLANEGNTDPTKTTAWAEGVNQINQQALTAQVQMVNQLISTAFQASGAATSAIGASSAVTSALDKTLMDAAQLQVQQDQAFQQASSSALQSFGLLAALSGKFGGSNTTATA